MGNPKCQPPPHNPEAEQSVLGAILVRQDVLPRMADLLESSDFYREDHKLIFKAMLDLYGRGEPVDLVTINAILKKRGQLDKVGTPDMSGPVFLASLSEQTPFATNAEHYAKIVKEKSIIRKLGAKAEQIARRCKQPVENLADFLQLAESEIYEITGSNGFKKDRLEAIASLIRPAQDFIRIEFPTKKSILFPWIKEYQVIMIYGPRGIGKTMFAVSLLAAIVSGKAFGPWQVENPVNCLYLDGEMPPQDTMERLKYLFGDEHQAKLFIYNDAEVTSQGLPGANLLNEDWRKVMKDILLRNNIKVWVVDNIASLAPGIDENSKQDWDPINKWFLELRAAGITTIFLHHANKDGGQRGTSGREDNIDISVLLDWPKNYQKEDGTRFVVKFEKARIQHQDLHLIIDSEFWLQPTEDGQQVWTFGSVKKQNKVQVLRMLDEGMAANEIAEVLKITKGRVSQIKAEAFNEGLLTKDGKMTQSGFAWLQKN
jgi:RecA-family ATPase